MDSTFGLYFPLVFQDGALVAPKILNILDASIRHIMVYSRRERYFMSEFGAGLEEYLGTPASADNLALLEANIKLHLIRWEPRIRFDDVVAKVNQDGVVNLTILGFIPSINQKIEFLYAV